MKLDAAIELWYPLLIIVGPFVACVLVTGLWWFLIELPRLRLEHALLKEECRDGVLYMMWKLKLSQWQPGKRTSPYRR